MRTNLLRRENTIELEIREATMRPRSFDATANTIEAVIATDAPVSRRDARGAYSEILDIAGADLSAIRGAPALNSHKQGDVGNILGTVAEAWREGTSALVARIQLSTRPEVAAIIEDIRNGVIANVSVGYEVQELRDGTDTSGNRTRTAVKWTPREVSFVPVPADRNARTRSASDRHQRKIEKLATRMGVDPAPLLNLSVREARDEIIMQLQNRSVPIHTAMHNRTTMDNPEAFIRATSDALLTRILPGHKPAPEAVQYVGLTTLDHARQYLQRAGVNIMGMAPVTVIERALATSDFPLMLVEAMNKALRPAYDNATSAIRRLARESTAQDFRLKHKLMLDSTGLELEKVTELGEFRSGSLAEGDETYKLGTYGKIIPISRQAMVNDDLSAFSDLSRRLGQSAAGFEAGFLVNLVTSNPKMRDGKEVFHADHGNLAGSGAAPSETTLSAARLAMRRQTGLSGGLIVVNPVFVVVPPELETSTEKVLTAIRPVVIDNANPFSNLQLVVEPRLTDAKKWYVWSDPAKMDGLEFSYLAGQPGVQIESRVGFHVDGMEVKARLDFGGGWIDHRGVYCNPGQ